MRISHIKISIITLTIFFILSLVNLYSVTVTNQQRELIYLIEKNQNFTEGHLKYITSLYNPRKILRRYYNDKTTIKELEKFLNSMEKNNPTVKNYLSVDNSNFDPELPGFVLNSKILKDSEYNSRGITEHNNQWYLLNKMREKDSVVICTYNVKADETLKERILETDFIGFYMDDGTSTYNWYEEDVNSNNIPVDLKEYKMSFNEKIIKVENSIVIPGFYFLISDKHFVDNVTYSFLKKSAIYLAIYLILFGLNIFISFSQKKTINSIEEIINNGSIVNKGKFLSKEYYEIINKVKQISKSNLLLNEEIISNNKKLKKLEGLSKNKMNFLAQISHEIRTPMNCIIGFSEMILSEKESKNNKVFANKIIEESETLLKLINDILDDSKIDSGKMILECNRVNLEEFFSRMIDLGNSYDTNNLIDIEYFIDNSLPLYIGIDELRFYQVVTNVYFNALKYTPIGSIKINIIKGFGNKISISIMDTGIGIPSDKLPTIFDDYERVNGKLNTGFRGTGLGLSITKKIIELMNGSISVESEQGTGSSFTITLPYKDVDQKLETSKKICSSSYSFNIDGDVLLVEDYPTNRIIAKRHLESAGLKVTMAENGKEAIELANEKKFDIILMDIQMPIMDGFTATKEIRELCSYNQNTPIVAMTANGLKSVEERSKQFLMNGVILKPIKKVSFLKTVSSYIKNPLPVN